MRFALILCATLLLAGCNNPFDDSGEALDDLKKNQARWAALGIRDYQFDYSFSCFCPPPHGFVRILVRNNQVVSATELQPANPPQPIPAGWARTIDEIFVMLIDRARRADSMTVAFHTTYYFPAQVDADPIKNAIDDEFGLRIQNFQPLR